MPLLATETPRRFFLFRERLLCARPCAELGLPDSRESAALSGFCEEVAGRPETPRASAHTHRELSGCLRDATRARAPTLTHGGLTEGEGGGLRRVKRQGELFRCHQGGKVPRPRGADSWVHAVPAPRARSQHGRRGRGRGNTESGQEGGGVASAEPVRKRGMLGAPDGGAEVRAPPGRSRRAGVVDQAPAREPWSSRGREAVKRRPREMRRRPPRSGEPRPSAIAASRCRLFLYSLPP